MNESSQRLLERRKVDDCRIYLKTLFNDLGVMNEITKIEEAITFYYSYIHWNENGNRLPFKPSLIVIKNIMTNEFGPNTYQGIKRRAWHIFSPELFSDV